MIEIIVAADEPALFFDSVSTAERALEWIDVRDGVYTAIYGRAGQVFELSEDGRAVFITPATVEPRPHALRELLVRFLDAGGVPSSPADTVETLLVRCEPWVSR